MVSSRSPRSRHIRHAGLDLGVWYRIERREEARDLLVKQVRRSAHDGSSFRRLDADHQLLSTLSAKGQIRRPLLFEERSVDGAATREKLLRSREHFRWRHRSRDFLEHVRFLLLSQPGWTTAGCRS